MVFSAGRLVSKKGFEYLIDAAAALRGSRPTLRVVIAGDGDLREALAARARETGAAVTCWARNPQDRRLPG